MQMPLAEDLAALHERYSAEQILALVRGESEVTDEQLFLSCYLAYDSSAHDNAPKIAHGEYKEFLRTKKVPLFVARALLPNYEVAA